MIGFLIGRFQPFHLGHLEAIKFALSKVEHLHLGIGSSNKNHEKRNPFTADERKKMILSSLDDDYIISFLMDFRSDEVSKDSANEIKNIILNFLTNMFDSIYENIFCLIFITLFFSRNLY